MVADILAIYACIKATLRALVKPVRGPKKGRPEGREDKSIQLGRPLAVLVVKEVS